MIDWELQSGRLLCIGWKGLSKADPDLKELNRIITNAIQQG